MRRELLKQYIFSLLVEGEFEGMTTFAPIAKKATSMFMNDLPIIITELVQTTAENSGNRLSAFIFEKANALFKDVEKRGLKTVWSDLQDQYKRGMEAKYSK